MKNQEEAQPPKVPEGQEEKPQEARAHRVPVSRVRVLQTALALADETGLEALTMRALGQALGVQAMSLYNHVANKEALLDAMVDQVVSEIVLPSPEHPWQAEMRRRAHSAHTVLMRHPWACGLLMSRANVGPAMLRYVDATIGCLRAAGFSLPMVDHAWNALDSFIYGFTLQKLHFPFKAGEYAAKAAFFLPLLPAEQLPHMRAMTLAVANRQHDGLHTLDFGLELILEGLEKLRHGEKEVAASKTSE